jgi:hypothetical protein
MLVIDGQEVSWDEMGRMLMTFEGWQFRLTADSDEGGHLFQTDPGHHSNLMAAR